MATNSTMPTPSSTEGEQFLCDDWFDPLENGVRTRIRVFIDFMTEQIRALDLNCLTGFNADATGPSTGGMAA